MTHDTPPKRITREEAQAAVDPMLVAEILRDFGANFDKVYPVGVLARGVGPEQSMIGLAIKRGHLVTRSEAEAMVAAALRGAADLADTTFSGSGTDAAMIIRNAILASIPQPASAALDKLIAEAVKAERERCAKIADFFAEQDYAAMGYPEDGGIAASGTAHMIRQEIRATKGDQT